MLVCGGRELDLGALEAHTLYDDGYSAGSQVGLRGGVGLKGRELDLGALEALMLYDNGYSAGSQVGGGGHVCWWEAAERGQVGGGRSSTATPCNDPGIWEYKPHSLKPDWKPPLSRPPPSLSGGVLVLGGGALPGRGSQEETARLCHRLGPRANQGAGAPEPTLRH